MSFFLPGTRFGASTLQRVPEPAVTMFATEELTPELRSAVIDVCIAAHEVEDFRNLFTTFIPSGGRHFLAFRGEELVSHAVVTPRWLQQAQEPIMRTAYVDAVSSLPSAQGLGFGSAAMRALVAAIDDFEVGCLQTDKVGFYDRLGWELWRGPLAGRDGDELIPTPDQRGVMIFRLPSTPQLDLDAQLSIERQPTRFWE
jgi:aminoglycoside 2'-N-acetyltransferase I